MVIVIENQEDCIFEYAVSLHTRRAKCVPTFYLGNEEMIELLIEKEIIYHQGLQDSPYQSFA